VAEGLAHAHERGIVHRDLKPANVLLTDDGQPMLLDFNLAEDAKARSGMARVGGTLPYMAPEHIRAFRGEPVVVDGRSDLYALGVILYELLGARPPFPPRKEPPHLLLDVLLADRQAPPASVRQFNKDVSPAVSSIVQHCLEPLPQHRYQSAHELLDDLERQLAHRPLRHAANPSWRERARKWARRNRRLALCLAAGAVMALSALPVAGLYVAREASRTRSASAMWEQSRTEMRQARFVLDQRSPDRAQRAAAIDQGRGILARYGVLEGAWREQPNFRYLPPREQERLRERIHDLLLQLTRATTLQALDEADTDRRHQRLEQAWQLNVEAEANAPGELSRTGWLQRAELARLLGRPEEANALRQKAESAPLETARDHFLLGADLLAQGRFAESLPLLRQATQLDGEDYWAWYARANCHFELEQDHEAIGCYNACAALGPGTYQFHFNRALAYLRDGAHERARDDFDRAVELAPEEPALYLNRAILWQGLGKHAEAIADLNRAIAHGSPEMRVYLLRARSKQQLGDAAGARRDWEEGLKRRPADPVSWVARGVARLGGDAAGAVGDFDEALKLHPRFLPALQNKAYALAEPLRRPRAALEVLNQAVRAHPDHAVTYLGRGVLRARLGQVRAARADAKAALARDQRPPILYQAANIYALTSPSVPEDRARAIRLLARALRGGFGLGLVANDPDFKDLRNVPAFHKVIANARALHEAEAQGR
jgi:tetratricopeptide (TPR) repeat protein